MNLHILRGHTSTDVEIRTYHDDENGEKIMAKVNFAVNRRFRREEKSADFFNCVAFGRNAKTLKEHVKKGTHLLITGRMENNNYEKDGIKVYGYNFVIETIEFLDKKGNPIGEPVPDGDGFMQISDEVLQEAMEVFGG